MHSTQKTLHKSLRLSCIVALATLASAVSAATVTITSTYVIAAGATYDGHGNTIKAVGLGNGNQGESQKAFFRLSANSTLKNVKLAAPGVDGCHFYGSGKIQNVTWEDIGEDAFTVKTGGNCTVSGGAAYHGADKCGQCNAPASLTQAYFYTDGCLKNVRQNGGTTYKCNFYFDHNTAKHTGEAIGRTDSSTTRFGYRSMTVQNFSGSKGWWYGRDSQAYKY